MCTVILLHRPHHDWPLLLAANRDEMLARPWQAPAVHWPDVPGVVAGRDRLAGGTWLGVNPSGVVAAVLNRTGSLGPQAEKRSRGVLPLLALGHATAADAARHLAGLDGGAWRSFNAVVADAATAWCVRGLGRGNVQCAPLPPGLHMVTSTEPNDRAQPRIARNLPRFATVTPPVPPDWGAWPDLLADSEGAWAEALNVPPRDGFGTVSAALVAVAPGRTEFRFAAGPPGLAPFQEVALPGPVSPPPGGCYSGGLTQTAPAPAMGGV